MDIVNYNEPEVPEWSAEVLEQFGVNPYGNPNYRIVYAPTKRELRYAFMEDVNKMAWQYQPHLCALAAGPHFVLDKWFAPHNWGDSAEWHWSKGPYPEFGDYQQVTIFDGELISTTLMPETLMFHCHNFERQQKYSAHDIRNAQEEERRRKEAQEEADLRDIVADAMMPMRGLGWDKMVFDYEEKMNRKIAQKGMKIFEGGFRQKGKLRNGNWY